MWPACLLKVSLFTSAGSARPLQRTPHSLLAACALPACCPCLLLPQVLIDRLSVQKLGLKYLRSQIGLVGQEPIMFR
jgi:hypothetical protein